MIEKMKLLHITGPKADIDRVVKFYLNKYDIHFENAMSSLGNLKNVRPFVETNLYKDTAQRGEELKEYLDSSHSETIEMRAAQAQVIVDEVYEQIKDVKDKQDELWEKTLEIKQWMEEIAPFIGLYF